LALFDTLHYFVVGKQFGEISIWKYNEYTKQSDGDKNGPSRTSTLTKKADGTSVPEIKEEESVMG